MKMDIFSYIHKDKEKFTRKTERNLTSAETYEEVVADDIEVEPQQQKVVDKLSEDVKGLKVNLVNKISREKVKLNPSMSQDLIDQIELFESFMKKKIPGMPSYTKRNEDGTVEVSLRTLLDTREFLENETGIEPLSFFENFKRETLYERYDMGNGFSVNSYGAVHHNNYRVFNPDDIYSIPVSFIDFSNDTIGLGFNKRRYGYNELIPGAFIIKITDLKFKVDELKKGLFFPGQDGTLAIKKPTEQDYKDINEKVVFNNEDTLFVSLGDFYDGYSEPNQTIIKLKKYLAELATKSQYLNAEVETETDDPRKKNYMMLYFLLLLGGGRVGRAPLPDIAKPCASYIKPQRGGFGLGNEQPKQGCLSKTYATGHNKIYDYSTRNGITLSLIQLIYTALTPFYYMNLRGYSIKFSVLGVKVKLDIIKAMSIGGELEAGLCSLQEVISSYIRDFFSVRKYIKLPSLTNDGTGYSFSEYEKYDLANYLEVQIEIYLRINFARIFNFVEKEQRYGGENEADILESKLNSVVSIYSNVDTYKLAKMNSYKTIDYNKAHEMYNKGFHILYNDNSNKDNCYLTLSDDDGAVYNELSPSNIWTILENSMDDMNVCDAKELKLELFNGSDFSKNDYEYSF